MRAAADLNGGAGCVICTGEKHSRLMEIIPPIQSKAFAVSGPVDTRIYAQTVDIGGGDDLIKKSHFYGNCLFSICLGEFAK